MKTKRNRDWKGCSKKMSSEVLMKYEESNPPKLGDDPPGLRFGPLFSGRVWEQG